MAELKPTTPQASANCYGGTGVHGPYCRQAAIKLVLYTLDSTAGSDGIPLAHVWSELYGNKRCMKNHIVNSYELKSMADT